MNKKIDLIWTYFFFYTLQKILGIYFFTKKFWSLLEGEWEQRGGGGGLHVSLYDRIDYLIHTYFHFVNKLREIKYQSVGVLQIFEKLYPIIDKRVTIVENISFY